MDNDTLLLWIDKDLPQISPEAWVCMHCGEPLARIGKTPICDSCLIIWREGPEGFHPAAKGSVQTCGVRSKGWTKTILGFDTNGINPCILPEGHTSLHRFPVRLRAVGLQGLRDALNQEVEA